MTSATVLAIKISCAGWVVEKLSSGLLNALFVPKPPAVRFPAKPRIVPLSGLGSGPVSSEKRKNLGGINCTISVQYLYCTDLVRKINAPIQGRA
jgi:hypothetical protein